MARCDSLRGLIEQICTVPITSVPQWGRPQFQAAEIVTHICTMWANKVARNFVRPAQTNWWLINRVHPRYQCHSQDRWSSPRDEAAVNVWQEAHDLWRIFQRNLQIICYSHDRRFHYMALRLLLLITLLIVLLPDIAVCWSSEVGQVQMGWKVIEVNQPLMNLSG